MSKAAGAVWGCAIAPAGQGGWGGRLWNSTKVPTLRMHSSLESSPSSTSRTKIRMEGSLMIPNTGN